MTAVSERRCDAHAVLFGGTAEQHSLRDALRRAQVFETMRTALGVLGSLARDSVESEIVREIHAMLGARLGDVILAGFRRSGDLIAAARETAADPSLSRTVNLGAHVIDATENWTIDVRCQSIVVPIRCVLEITVTLDVHVTVHAGSLVGMHDSDAQVLVSLSSLERPIAKGERTVRMCEQVDLRAPISLLPVAGGQRE